MTGDSTTLWLLAAAFSVVVFLAVLLAFTWAALRNQRRAQSELDAAVRAANAETRAHARAATEQLRAEVEELREQAAVPAGRTQPGYVITRLGERSAAGASAPPAAAPARSGSAVARREVAVAGRIDGRLFVDLVVRETLVRVGSVAHGATRAFDPVTRNRIRFEMRREVKRSRKARKAEVKAVRREMHARERAAQGIGEGTQRIGVAGSAGTGSRGAA